MGHLWLKHYKVQKREAQEQAELCAPAFLYLLLGTDSGQLRSHRAMDAAGLGCVVRG